MVPMVRVRLLGPRDALTAVLAALQDLGELHPAKPRATLGPAAPESEERRSRRHVGRVLDRVEAALALLPVLTGERPVAGAPVSDTEIAAFARRARTVLRDAGAAKARIVALEEEQALLQKYSHFFASLDQLRRAAERWPSAATYHVVLKRGGEHAIGELRAALTTVLGDQFDMWTEKLPTGETALLLLTTTREVRRIESVLADAGVTEVPLPESLGAHTAGQMVTTLESRLQSIPGEIDEQRRTLHRLAELHRAELLRVQVALRDALGGIDALEVARATDHAFVLEGWLPQVSLGRLRTEMERVFAGRVAVEELAREEWRGDEAPVVMHNPRLFRPFEIIVKVLPLPRYGTIDPTPFVAVFFPMLFGIILGDMGYGLVLAILAAILHRRAKPGSTLRMVSEIAGPCAAFAIIFGLLFGEFLGSAGHLWFGLEPLLFNREEALLPFLGLAIAIGFVHIVLGLVLSAIAKAKSAPRHALGSGVMAFMVVLVVAAILSALEVLPRGFFTPVVIALLVAFPVLIIAEGMVAAIELLSTLGHILSYARVMALGTASVMMAVAANRMVGTMGSIVVGVLFGLLFHLVNFALGLFSPTIHALRLHYVEFFGTFFSPGGVAYRPLRHWKPMMEGRSRG
jgi:V/A-type H+-transporting ATPase subunit I